jgi:anti-anti-sigma regulatory factor
MNSTPFPPDADLDPIVLPANCDTVAAEELQVRLVLAADRLDAIRVDAGQVDNVGQAVLQLLVAARSEAEARGLDFALLDPSAAFLARTSACRLAEPLGISVKEPAL